jgi:D-alanine--poly(phosphoribitol) ligase subunit 2
LLSLLYTHEMVKSEIVETIVRAMRDNAAGRPLPEPLGEGTVLFGKSGVLDSLGLITLVVEVEAQINDATGASIVIANERAMSQQSSPFRTVGALAQYVEMLLAEGANVPE